MLASRDLVDKVIVITGASAGIGLATATALAERGARLRLLNRSPEKSAPLVEELRRLAGHDDIVFIPLDLGALASVRTAAATMSARREPIDVLINNAGVGGQRGLTADGFEVQFGTNHLGHFLLTELLLPRLREASQARIVNVSSRAHYQAHGFEWEALTRPTRTVTAMDEYRASKLANVLHARELARRLAGTGITTYSLHPGVIASDIWKRIPPPLRQLGKLFMASTTRGARASLRCATDPALASESGRYYHSTGLEKRANPLIDDAALAAELWQRSAAWTRASGA